MKKQKVAPSNEVACGSKKYEISHNNVPIVIPTDYCFKTKNMLIALDSEEEEKERSYASKLISKKTLGKRGRKKIETNRYLL